MLAPYLVHAFNTAKESENKIHDDSVAARFGFTGGLVPGVDVYAYMTHQAVAKWGRAWLEHGTAECRFGKPVYDGEIAELGTEPGGSVQAYQPVITIMDPGAYNYDTLAQRTLFSQR